EQAEALVITGDLCYDVGKAEIYTWIREVLDEQPLPYYVIPGNHDDTELLVTAFGLEQHFRAGQLYYASAADQPPVVFLDSRPGIIGEEQLIFLRTYLAKQTGPVVVFVHHPPAQMGVPFMDEHHALRNGEQLLEVLHDYGQAVTVFCGHYHVDKSLRIGNVDLHVTPSCFFQIDWHFDNFAVDHRRCAYRWIDWNGTRLEHAVVYVEGE
ncbi:MAG: metallophosphoesterase, partial [Bacteroidota bacterium]